ncbi:MAG: LuxR C-terminal-related transcriptional regulator, partial [Tateyamaria sp.]
VLPSVNPGPLKTMCFAPLTDSNIETLNATAGHCGDAEDGRVWKALCCSFQNSTRDCIAMKLHQSQDIAFIQQFLEKIWPVLREDCLTEARDMQLAFGNDALLWMASDRIDVAILVMDMRGQTLRINLAAKELLDTGAVLRQEKGGIVASNEVDTHELLNAVAACTQTDAPARDEEILFLEGGPHGTRVPVSLSRYYHAGEPTDRVVARLPMPPDPARIEVLGRKLGLTPSEARVAVLMQSGLTNREAACRAGLKEQTFNTYAKRVLGKLNVAGRAEMAQLLTWQAAGRRIA